MIKTLEYTIQYNPLNIQEEDILSIEEVIEELHELKNKLINSHNYDPCD